MQVSRREQLWYLMLWMHGFEPFAPKILASGAAGDETFRALIPSIL